MTRRIKDAIDVATNEPIYFKSHAKATYMSDGATVEDAINAITNNNDNIQAPTESQIAAMGFTKNTGTITGIKMNGTSKGTSGVVDLGTVITAHQDISGKADKASLATVATTGNYNDLSNKPTIPSAVTESTVSGWGFTKNTGTYSKPSGGIPKTDLASAVQTSLGKADTALQSHQQLKTINGQSIIGSGDITISGGSSGGSGAYPEVDGTTYEDVFTQGTYACYDAQPNTFYVFPECTDLSFYPTSNTPQDGLAHEYLFQFTSGSEPTSLILPDDIKWANDEAPVIEANKIYQISILKGLGSVLEFDNTPTLIDNKVTVSISGTKYLVGLQYAASSDIVIKVRTLDGPISVNILSGELSKTVDPLGPMADSTAYIESITPAADNNYNYIW